MAKIYVAGNDTARARRVMDDLIEAGHSITFDWVISINDKSDDSGKAFKEREAIRECDVLVYLWAANQESARFEAGMAMGLGKKIIVSADHQAWFFALPEVIQVDSDSDILAVVNSLKLYT